MHLYIFIKVYIFYWGKFDLAYYIGLNSQSAEFRDKLL